MTRAPALPATDRLLTLREVGERIHLTGRHLRAAVEASNTLKAGRRYHGRHPKFLESAVVRYMHVEMAATPQAKSGAA